jgi:hypothetical protein
VVIPYADRITVLDGFDERGYKILFDMMKAFCAFRYAIRETDDRAATALEMLKGSHGWMKDEAGYYPPPEEPVA